MERGGRTWGPGPGLLVGLFVAAFASLAALAAPTAPAQGTPEYFHTDDSDVVVLGREIAGQEFRFGAEAPPITCGEADLEGRLQGVEHEAEELTYTSENELTVGAGYQACEALGEPVTVDSCHLGLEPTATGSGAADLIVLGCESGIRFTIPSLELTVTVVPQLVENALTYENLGAGKTRAIRADVSATGVEYTCAPAGACSSSGIATSGADGAYLGALGIEAYEHLEGWTGGYVYGEKRAIWHGPTEEEVGEEGEAFDGHAEDLTLTGEGGAVELELSEEAEPVTCEGHTLEGRVAPPAGELRVHPEFSGCEYQELAVEIDSEGCHLSLGEATDEAGHAPVALAGCLGGSMSLSFPEFPLLRIETPNQAAAEGVHHEDEGAEDTETRGIAVATTLSGLDYQCSSEFLCTLASFEDSGSEARLSGEAVLAGFVHEGGFTGSYSHGEQVGVWYEAPE